MFGFFRKAGFCLRAGAGLLFFLCQKEKKQKKNRLIAGLGTESGLFLFCCFFVRWNWLCVIAGSSFLLCQKKRSKRKTDCKGAWVLARAVWPRRGGRMIVAFFWCAGIWQIVVEGSSFLFEKEKNQKKITRPGVGARRAPAGAGVLSFLFV